MVERPVPDEALYEVQVWNVDTSEADWSILTTGKGLGASVDQAEEVLSKTLDDEQSAARGGEPERLGGLTDD